ncbi:Nucleoid occlusion protein [subsurface metagenome]
MAKVSKEQSKAISLSKIDLDPNGDRLEMDEEELKSLALNIDEVGLINAIIVRPVGDRFEVVAGERRYLAYGILGRKEIRCVVKICSDSEVALLRASENLGRVNLSLIEEAKIYRRLEEKFGMSHDEIGKRFGKSPGVVKRRLDLLKMPDQLQRAVHKKEISYGVAEELWRISDVGEMDYYLSFAVEHGVTVAVARSWVKDWKDTLRRSSSDVVGGGPTSSPLESRPVWVTCDLCHGPMELGKEQVFRCCPGCSTTIQGAVVGVQNP